MTMGNVPLLALLAPGALGIAGIVGLVNAHVHLLSSRLAGIFPLLPTARRAVASHLLGAAVIVFSFLSLVVGVVLEQTMLGIVSVDVGFMLPVYRLGNGAVVQLLLPFERDIDNVAPVFGYLYGRRIDVGALAITKESRLVETATHDDVVALILHVVGAEIAGKDTQVVSSELYPAATIGVARDVEAYLASLAARFGIEVSGVGSG